MAILVFVEVSEVLIYVGAFVAAQQMVCEGLEVSGRFYFVFVALTHFHNDCSDLESEKDEKFLQYESGTTLLISSIMLYREYYVFRIDYTHVIS